jgi:hypothetical protein
MFLGAYHFDGLPANLVSSYDQLMESFPSESLELHVCVIKEGGISVFDACPSREEFDQFSHSDEFRAAVAASGLPIPRVEPLGEVHTARIREAARR